MKPKEPFKFLQNPTDLIHWKKIFYKYYILLKYDIGPKAQNLTSIIGEPNLASSSHVKSCLSGIKNCDHQIGPTSRWNGVGVDFNLLANHKWGFQASRCKAVFSCCQHHVCGSVFLNKLTNVQLQRKKRTTTTSLAHNACQHVSIGSKIMSLFSWQYDVISIFCIYFLLCMWRL